MQGDEIEYPGSVGSLDTGDCVEMWRRSPSLEDMKSDNLAKAGGEGGVEI